MTQENPTFENLFSTSAIEMIAASDESTLVGKFEPSAHKREGHQSEDELEKTFIQQLQEQGYEFLPISTEADLIQNLRLQLEKLNKFQFTDLEWDEFFKNKLSRPNAGILEKTKMLQLENTAQILEGEDGYDRNIHLIDKKNLHRNKLQVINQYRSEGEKRSHRYDVTILLNGLPIVHVELKRRGIAIRQAFNQINRYQRESFWEGSGLFQYVQLFVISNGTDTKYYSNTTRLGSIEAQNKVTKQPKQSSNSFAFTSNWADFHNKNILDLEDFTKTFFAKHTLLNILTRYCVLDAQDRLLVMRPYQIAATEQILSRIKTAANNPQSKNAKTGGYIWHTTGSGKTLTSFKAAQLACKMDEIDKVLFVVDRKDLDYQTMKEYDRFEKGAANANASTKILKEQLEKPSAKIIVTTIQKLSHFIKSDKNHPIKHQKIALIFDECHRSQFGEMHRDITKFFKNYHLFGFTGTPIFNLNQKKGGSPNIATTMQVFGDRLHAYTIVDAIKDKNVLGFKVSYHSTVKKAYETEDEPPTKENEEIFLASERISQITSYILENFQTKTYRNKSYKYEAKRRTGFNALFATASIKAARLYYEEFKHQQENLPSDKKLKIGMIYSYAPNEAEEENSDGTEGLDGSSRDFLDQVIADYNEMFQTNYNSGSGFSDYYKNLSQRLKDGDLDLVIVVNMFLTGFDAPCLNTLWVDKNLKYHGLIQAYSRTNRILNSVKQFGNIITFRDLENATNEALQIFGNKEAIEFAILKPYAHFLEEYQSHIDILLKNFPLNMEIIGETKQKDFIQLFGKILKLLNILKSFDEFDADTFLSPAELQDYRSRYLDLYEIFKQQSNTDSDTDIPLEGITFEIELLKQVEINIDYILKLVEEYLKENKNAALKENITKLVNANPSLRNKRELINDFMSKISSEDDIPKKWQIYIDLKKEEELEEIIKEERLKPELTHEFIKDAFIQGIVPEFGTGLAKILPPQSRFSKNNPSAENKKRVLQKLSEFLERFLDI
ncbi:type I restriction endonuclease subunit R [Acetobacteraceae bacterium]|nr:type I restriction endonuclease subunit R [Acetobacteraceae bacterium]